MYSDQPSLLTRDPDGGVMRKYPTGGQNSQPVCNFMYSHMCVLSHIIVFVLMLWLKPRSFVQSSFDVQAPR